MKFALIAALLCLLPMVMAQSVPIPYTNCGASTDHVKINQATASTWPPVPGQPISLNVSVALDENLPGGTYILAVSLDGFQIINQQGQLSDLDPNITWPIKAGSWNIAKTVTVPSIIPGGTTVVANVSALDTNGQELLCIGLEIDIPSAATEEQQYEEMEAEIEAELADQEPGVEIVDDQTETDSDDQEPLFPAEIESDDQ